MKSVQKVLLLVGLLFVGALFFTSCNNSSKKGNKGSSNEQNQFTTTVNQFDSSWDQRVQVLNDAIHKWDSSAQEKKESLQGEMESRLDSVKAKRDSLVDFLNKSQKQTEDTWGDFKKSVAKKYKSTVRSLNELSKE